MASLRSLLFSQFVSGAENTFLKVGTLGTTVQPLLVSNTNIKTVVGQTLLGSGNVVLSASDIPNLDASKITSGLIDAARLPSYVDDVLEVANYAALPVTGETGKIYVTLDNNKTYRWSGSAYIEISAAPDLSGYLQLSGGTMTGNLTLNAGTANGVAYLNGSKVVTSGSALTFDGSGTLGVTSSSNVSLTLTSTSGYSQLVLSGGSSANYITSDDPLSFYLAGSEQMRLNSTGLGIGTSNPAAKLDVVGTGSIISATRADTNRADIIVTNNGGTVAFGINNSAGNWLTGGLAYYGYILGPSSASYGLQFGVGAANTAAVTINPTGNVGIGTSSPGYPLDVVSNSTSAGIRVRARAADALGYIAFASNNAAATYALLGTPDANVLAFYTNGFNERARITSGGNFGIGTTSPSQKLQVYDAGTVYTIVETGNAGAYSIFEAKNPSNSLLVWNRGDNNTSIVKSTAWDLLIGTDAAKYLSFFTNSTERARITSGGQFGLGYGGAFSASANLNILTGGQGGGIQLNRNTSGNPTTGQSLGTFAWKGIDSANTNAASEAMIEALAAENHTGLTAATAMLFYTKPSGTGPGSAPSERMRITDTGRVGIGTSGPAWPLTVKSTSSATAAVFLYDGSFGGTDEVNVGLRFYNGGGSGDTPQVKLRAYGTTNYTGNFAIDVLQGGTYPNTLLERFTIQGTTGNVGIGTASPGEKLEVAGNILINTSANPSMTVKTSGGGNNPWYRLQADTNFWDMIGVFSDANDTLRFRYNNSDYLTITNDGIVRIGNTTGGTSGLLRVGTGFSGTPDGVLATSIRLSGSLEFDYDGVSGTQRHGRIRGTSGNGQGGAYGGGLAFQYYAWDGTTYNWSDGMSMDAGGNLGIGTSTPSSILELKNAAPQIALNGTTTSGYRGLSLQYAGAQYGFVGLNVQNGEFLIRSGESGQSGYYLSFQTNGSERMRVDSSGNLGVGTSSPSQKLHVAGRTYFATTSTAYEGGFVSGAANTYVLLYAQNTSGTLYMGVNGTTAASGSIDVTGILDNASYFGSRTSHATQILSNNSARITINSTGNVGIGTTSPQYRLDVSDIARISTGIIIPPVQSNLYNTDGALSNYGTNNAVYLNGSGSNGWLRLNAAGSENDQNSINIFASANSRIEFRTGNSERMRITGSGNIGIGTTGPSAKLDVYVTRTSSTSATAIVLSDNVTGGQTDGVYKAIRSISNGSNSVSEIRFIETDGSNNNTAIGFATAHTAGGLTERFRIGPGGAIGLNGANYGTSGQVLTSNGSGSTPSWQSVSAGGGFSNLVVFTSSGTWTVPSGVTKCKVTVVGAGGGGPRSANGSAQGLSGGGAGGAAIKVLTLSGGSATITVGSGGSGGGYDGGPGSGGGSSSFIYGATTLTGNGGSGGGYSDQEGGAGGTASGGDINITGGGGSGMSNATAAARRVPGGSSIFGGSTKGSSDTYGAGAQGAQGAGLSGGNGIVIIEY